VADFLALERFGDAFLTELRQQQHGVLARRFPEFWIQRLEKALDARLPRPQEVVSELVEFLQHRHTMVFGRGEGT